MIVEKMRILPKSQNSKLLYENKEKIDYIMKQCKDKDFKGINDWIDENILCKKANIEEIKELICS